MEYLIVIEETKTGFSAYSPDVDGCVATGKTKQEVEQNMQQALAFHMQGLLMGNQIIPHSHNLFELCRSGSNRLTNHSSISNSGQPRNIQRLVA